MVVPTRHTQDAQASEPASLLDYGFRLTAKNIALRVPRRAAGAGPQPASGSRARASRLIYRRAGSRGVIGAMLRIVALLPICLGACAARGQAPASDWAERMNQANAALRAGDVSLALDGYQQASKLKAQSDELDYNRAVALYRKGELEAAQQLFERVSKSPGDGIAARARYNAGNSRFASALQLKDKDPATAIRQLESAIQDYRSSLKIMPDTDARANIELAAKLIDQLQRTQQQQQQQPQQPQQPQEPQQNSQPDLDRQQSQPQQRDSSNPSEPQQSDSQDPSESEQSSSEQENQPSGQQDKQQGQGQAQPDEPAKQPPGQKHESKSDRQSESNQPQSNNQELNQQQPSQQSPGQQSPGQQSPGQQSPESAAQNNTPQDQADGQQSSMEENQANDQRSTPPSRNGQAGEDSNLQQQSSARDSARSDPSHDAPPDVSDDESDRQPTKPEGELKAANSMDAQSGDQASTAAGFDAVQNGSMTKDEAIKMLQAIRDRDLLRRLRRQAAERSRHVPVDKDW